MSFLFLFAELLYISLQQPTLIHSSVRSLRLSAVCNAGTANIYDGFRINAAAEASRDHARSLSLQFIIIIIIKIIIIKECYECKRQTTMRVVVGWCQCNVPFVDVISQREVFPRLCCNASTVHIGRKHSAFTRQLHHSFESAIRFSTLA